MVSVGGDIKVLTVYSEQTRRMGAVGEKWADRLLEIVIDQAARNGFSREALIEIASNQLGRKISGLAQLAPEELGKLYEAVRSRE